MGMTDMEGLSEKSQDTHEDFIKRLKVVLESELGELLKGKSDSEKETLLGRLARKIEETEK